MSKVFKSAVTVSMGKISGQVSQGYSHDVSQLGSHLRLLFPTQHCQGSVPWSCRIHTGFDFEASWSHFSRCFIFFLKAPLIRSRPTSVFFYYCGKTTHFQANYMISPHIHRFSTLQRKRGHIQNRNISGWNLGSPRRVLPSVITDKCVINKMCIVNRQ